MSSELPIDAKSPEPITLGGQPGEIGYHPLALDAVGDGVWGWIDRRGEQMADWLNPILIKEARQSLKSRQFLLTFFLLLAASCVWTILGVVLNAPDVYFVPSGQNLLAGYYFVLAIPMIGMVPLAAYRSLASEIDDDTFEMLIITKLSAMRIVIGKLHSAMLQMMIYFAAIVPCLAFSYLLRGVNLPTIMMMLAIIFFTAMITTSAALLMATMAPTRALQTLTILAVIGVILLAEIFCAAFCLSAVLGQDLGADAAAIMFTILTIIVGTSCIVIFIKAAAARIAPVSENRSTGLRWCMFAQSLLWVGTITLVAIWYQDLEPINFGMMILGGYWLGMGTLMLSESPELSPRIQRDLPSTFAGRAMLTWFNPGPSTGYVFAISSGTVAITTMGIFAIIITSGGAPTTPTPTFAMIVCGYLLVYLGIVRLIVLPITRRVGSSFALPVTILLVVMGSAAVMPTILSVVITGSPPLTYTPLEAINWAWTLADAFQTRYNPFLALTVLVVGLVVTLMNLALLFRVFHYRRISVPERVLQDSDG